MAAASSFWHFILPALLLLGRCQGPFRSSDAGERPIVIIHDNDVHCNAEGYVKMAGYRDAVIESDTAYVFTVSSGDFIQGQFIGGYSKGSYIIDIMKSVGFDAVTPGNHEFDFGIARQLFLSDALGRDRVVCANFISTDSHRSVYAPYLVRKCGSRKIAFVGVTTPATLASDYYSFTDGNYDIPEAQTVPLVQNAVDKARREGADYVVLLSHLGETVDMDSELYTLPLIRQTTGIDAVLDGHTHTVIGERHIKNARGEDVLLTQTGTGFSHFGKLTVSADGVFHSECIPDSLMKGYTNARVRRTLDSIYALCDSVRTEYVGHSDFVLTINGPDGQRLIRKGETNLGNLVCDAFLHAGTGTVSFMNGGGIRNSINAGDITFGNIVDVLPFGNELVNFEITGARIVQLLEESFSACPMESGAYLHTGGLTFTYHLSELPHVRDVRVSNADGSSSPISESAVYQATTSTYVLNDLADYPALEGCTPMDGPTVFEHDALKQFVIDCGGEIPQRYRNPQNRVTVVR